METLRFTQLGDEFVSDRITGATNVNLHLNFDVAEGQSATIHFDRTMDSENLGWSKKCSVRANDIYEDTIANIPTGVDIRIRTTMRPTSAKYDIID